MKITRLTPVYSHSCIENRVRELGEQISALYGDEPLVAVCVLKGAVVFFSDLIRHITDTNLTLDFVRLSSYADGMESGTLNFVRDLETDIRDKHVLIVEDVVDSGKSMAFLLEILSRRSPRSLRLAALVDKKERREAEVQVDFAGFELNQGFIVGYGLDCAERFRALPDICVAECSTD